MFKLFFVYPLVAFIIFWLASDVQVGASVYTFKDNYLALEFPKKQFRPDDHPKPYYSFYWNGKNPFSLKNSDKNRILELGKIVSKKLGVPFISVDVGKIETDDWKIIEVGDGQFSDIRQISSLKLWNSILEKKK